MKEFGNLKIRDIKICKNPITSTYETIINWVTLGTYNKNKKALNYDNMFHLYLLIGLENGQHIVYEKNQVVNISKFHPTEDDRKGICVDVDLKNKDITLNELLDKTVERLGVPNVWLYNAENSLNKDDVGNCQQFIDNTLTANGLNKPEYKDFVLQDANKIVGEMPTLTKQFIRGVTDFAGMLDRLLYGGLKNYM